MPGSSRRSVCGPSRRRWYGAWSDTAGSGKAGRGLPWGVGARDEGWPPLGKYGARLERAYRNFLETFPFFIAAVLLAHALGISTHNTVLGAQIYLWARVAYVPAYLIGIPFVRTLCWTAAIVGFLLIHEGSP